MRKHDSKIKFLSTLLCLIACTIFILQGCKIGPDPGKKQTLEEMASAIHSQTQANLIWAAKKMGHSVENGINEMKIEVGRDTFISFVLSDTLPDNFADGKIVGFVDVSGYGDRLPDGQYGVKIFFDENHLNKPSEFISVKTGEQYFFDTDIEKIDTSNSKNTRALRTKKDCTCIPIDIGVLLGSIVGEICLNCPPS